MSINYSNKLGTYVAQSAIGEVIAIYSPAIHGTLGEFRNAMSAQQ